MCLIELKQTYLNRIDVDAEMEGVSGHVKK